MEGDGERKTEKCQGRLFVKCQPALLGLEERDKVWNVKYNIYWCYSLVLLWFVHGDLEVCSMPFFPPCVKQTCFLVLRVRVVLGLRHLEGFGSNCQQSRKSLFKWLDAIKFLNTEERSRTRTVIEWHLPESQGQSAHIMVSRVPAWVFSEGVV